MLRKVTEILGEVLPESLVHTGTMLPALFVVFVLVELLETLSHKKGSEKLARAFAHPYLGPIAAAALGIIPQCGFSVVATTLFVEGIIPMGSLLSAYISTSDEALPVMLSDPLSLPWVAPLIAIKLIWGSVVGILVNIALLRKKARTEIVDENRKTLPDINASCAIDASTHNHDSNSHSLQGTHPLGEVVMNALSRTLRIGAVVFLLYAAINLVGHLAQEQISGSLSSPGFWQPFVASLVGLIPSCATSVAIAETFKAGLLSFPAAVSGLTSNGGIGPLVLVKECKNKRDVVTLIVLQIVSALTVGILVSLFWPYGYYIQ